MIATPVHGIRSLKPSTPASANRKTLARDILKALGPTFDQGLGGRTTRERSTSAAPFVDDAHSSAESNTDTSNVSTLLFREVYSRTTAQNVSESTGKDQTETENIVMMDNNTLIRPAEAHIEGTLSSSKTKSNFATSLNSEASFHGIAIIPADVGSPNFSLQKTSTRLTDTIANSKSVPRVREARETLDARAKVKESALPKKTPLFLPSSVENTPEVEIPLREIPKKKSA